MLLAVARRLAGAESGVEQWNSKINCAPFKALLMLTAQKVCTLPGKNATRSIL
ncbi:hypothetical protein H6G36_19810 [Anabaena minutissima FACHB-250]|nr:hypothetical protein [Anabaena minutissima FACHB-250]